MIVLDDRIFGLSRGVSTRSKRLMRIPDDMKKCAVFVAKKDDRDQYRFCGTAFCYMLWTPNGPSVYPYLVTAKHVIEGISREGSKIYLRFNTRVGGHTYIETEYSDWWTHETDGSVDIAVLPLENAGLLNTGVELFYVESRMCVNEQMTRLEGIGVGDDAFVIGLFTQHAGKSRNIPIVRVGNIAAMPEEKVESENDDIDAYLVELRSFGGLSGSPVFVAITRQSFYERSVGEPSSGTKIVFLGTIHGHWNIRDSTNDIVSQDVATSGSINQGIAMVVPAWKIEEVLTHSALVEKRAELDALRRRQSGAVQD